MQNFDHLRSDTATVLPLSRGSRLSSLSSLSSHIFYKAYIVTTGSLLSLHSLRSDGEEQGKLIDLIAHFAHTFCSPREIRGMSEQGRRKEVRAEAWGEKNEHDPVGGSRSLI